MDYRNEGTFLRSVNPAVKLLVSLMYMLTLTAVFDLALIAVWAGLAALLLAAGGRLSVARILKGCVPFLLAGLGFLWAHLLFPAGDFSAEEPLLSLGPLEIYAGPLLFGSTMAARAVAFGLLSMIFAATTDPMDFAVSLIRQLHLPARTAYSVFAAHRFLPLLSGDLANIKAAHRLRGLGNEGGLANRWTRMRRYTLPLFAGVMRKAGRAAMAMESRGLGTGPRTFRRDLRLRGRDLIYAGAALAVLLVTLIFAHRFGRMIFWSGSL